MDTKRKHHKVTLKVKCKALKELEKDRLNEDVANQLSIPGSTFATWKKSKEKIFEAFQNSTLKQQRVKTETYYSRKKRIIWKHGPNWPFYALMLRTKQY